MDTGVIVTGVAVILVAALPFIVFAALANLRRRRLTQAINGQAISAGLFIKQYEVFNRFAIAIDEDGTWLAFVKQVGSSYPAFTVNLSNVAGCRVVTGTKSEPGYAGVFTITTQRVELEFTWKNGESAPVLWELYNLVNDGTILRGEPEFADRWCQIITQHLVPVRPVNA